MFMGCKKIHLTLSNEQDFPAFQLLINTRNLKATRLASPARKPWQLNNSHPQLSLILCKKYFL